MRSGVEEEEDGKVRERIAGCEMNGWQSVGWREKERRRRKYRGEGGGVLGK